MFTNWVSSPSYLCITICLPYPSVLSLNECLFLYNNEKDIHHCYFLVPINLFSSLLSPLSSSHPNPNPWDQQHLYSRQLNQSESLAGGTSSRKKNGKPSCLQVCQPLLRLPQPWGLFSSLEHRGKTKPFSDRLIESRIVQNTKTL